ncbi:hypothetical protein [Nocardioides sp. zg-1230]|uniref:hypothetical protein n=1 Tax=Nocardioides sp. zg-1230 TaxID=2736601 RepID=UPI001556D08D|nr:hypothetical protein [Nocardioides sp. zg-1230]NPC44588.1 hypothetical protein [Nocardioides sp. zg-1230]
MTTVTTQRPGPRLRAGQHPLALRAPWYVGERPVDPAKRFDRFDVYDPPALQPSIQKYDSPELVQRIMADPRNSLRFTAEDEWSVPMPRSETQQKGSTGRLRFATHSFARMGMRKLFQPNHDRFYAVVVEVFCDHDGLPRPRPDDTFSLALAVRRQVLSTDLNEHDVRKMARDVLLGKVSATAASPVTVTGAQGWMTDQCGGGQGWVDVDPNGRPLPTAGADPDGEHALLLEKRLTENLLPMWRIPPDAADCDRASTRSLWFGLVPTASADRETAFDPALPLPSHELGPRYDDRQTYEIRCLATRPPGPGREDCPPEGYWSEPTRPYRLASFFDPEGTKNRTVSITMPDLRAVAARAGQPAAGGVAITTPPGSQLSFDPDNGSPGSPGLPPGGTVAQTCTYAVELFTIVAMFLFSLFLPVVMFLFQLWWMLLLKFCLPPAADAVEVLRNHFKSGGTPGSMGAAQDAALDEVVGGRGTGARLKTAASGFPAAALDDLAEGLAPPDDPPPPPEPEEPVPDPLCPLNPPAGGPT